MRLEAILKKYLELELYVEIQAYRDGTCYVGVLDAGPGDVISCKENKTFETQEEAFTFLADLLENDLPESREGLGW